MGRHEFLEDLHTASHVPRDCNSQIGARSGTFCVLCEAGSLGPVDWKPGGHNDAGEGKVGQQAKYITLVY